MTANTTTVLPDARAREVLASNLEHDGYTTRAQWVRDRQSGDIPQEVAVAAMLAFAKDATQPAPDAAVPAGEVEQLRADLHNVQRNTAIYRQEAKDRADAADRRAAAESARADAAVEANRRLIAMMETPAAAPKVASEGGLPDRFEAWWATYKHRNRDQVGYAIKKQIAFDAFEAAALATDATDGATGGGEVRSWEPCACGHDAEDDVCAYHERIVLARHGITTTTGADLLEQAARGGEVDAAPGQEDGIDAQRSRPGCNLPRSGCGQTEPNRNQDDMKAPRP